MGGVMTDFEIEVYEAEHQPTWLLNEEEEGENMTIGIDMYMDIDEKAKDEVKAMLLHHIERIMSLDEWPEIKSVYGVEVREVEE